MEVKINKQAFISLFFNTITKEYRKKSLLFIFIITIVGIILTNTALNFFYKEVLDPSASKFIGDKTIDFLLIFINWWSVILTTILGVGAVRSDFSSKTISQILSLPIRRLDFLLARYLGVVSIIFFYSLISFALAIILFSIGDKTYGFGIHIAYGFLFNLLNIFVVAILSILFSFFFSNILSFISVSMLTFFISLSNSHFGYLEFSKHFSELSFMKIIGLILHYVFPRVGNLNSISSTLLVGEPAPVNTLSTLSHFSVSIAILFSCVYFLFKKKDI